MTKHQPESGAAPIPVMKFDEWEVRNQLGETLIKRETKREAVKEAKEWARNHRHDRPVVIHSAGGTPQRAWWAEDQRLIRVRPMNGREKEKYSSMVQEWKNDGRREPFWSVEHKKDSWDLIDIEPVKKDAISRAERRQEEYNVKRISIYGQDWTQIDEKPHQIERRFR